MAEDIYFNRQKKPSGKPARTAEYTERIDSDSLKKSPGEMSFGDIVTENGKISSGVVKTPREQKKDNKKAKKKKKKLRFLRRLLGTAAAIIITLAVILTASVGYVLSDYEAQELKENEYTDEELLLHSSSVYNVLLMGIDTLNSSDSSRSDAMILMSLDMKNREIKLSSFLRDSYVNIPGYGNMKLNAACVYGGPQLVCDTIEANFGVRIDDYAKVGYDMFIKIIDAVGGVTIPEIDETEAKALRKEGFDTEPGTDIHVDGLNALRYCRIRKGQDDFYRTGRQREVITLVLKKLPLSNPVRLLNTAKEIAGTIECSIEKSDFPGLLIRAFICMTGDIGQMTVPADGTWYNDTKNYQAVLVVDFEENKEKLNEFLYK
ncbi:MAG: LCP family protein [Clostridia bacterium]|nr:LCP family protein [Clostridia bacterium]